MREHVFDPDTYGDCQWSGECPLPENSRYHVPPRPVDPAPIEPVEPVDTAPPLPSLASLGVVQGPSLSSTSQAAALAAWPRAGSQRERVLRAILAAGERGATDDELMHALPGFNPSSLRPRRLELIEAGFVRVDLDASGRVRTRATGSGRDAKVYVATPAARAQRVA